MMIIPHGLPEKIRLDPMKGIIREKRQNLLFASKPFLWLSLQTDFLQLCNQNQT